MKILKAIYGYLVDDSAFLEEKVDLFLQTAFPYTVKPSKVMWHNWNLEDLNSHSKSAMEMHGEKSLFLTLVNLI